MEQRPESIWIYALCDPNTLRVRYVGKSNNPKERLSGHLSERSLRAGNEKNAWLKSLLLQGLRPVLIILQEITHGCWAEAERAWICLFRMQGCSLTNTSDGGEGVLDQQTEAPTVFRPTFTRSPQGPRTGGVIPRRPGAKPPMGPRYGEQRSPQDKHGIDRTTTPRPPRRRKPRSKPRKKTG